MKTKLSFLLLLIFISYSNLYAQFTPQTPDLRLCGNPPSYYLNYFNCTSNNYTLDQVYLSLTNVNGVPINNTTCIPGTTQSVYVMLNYTSNSNSTVHNGRLFADLYINNVLTSLNVWMGDIAPGAGQRQLFGPFNWVCGQEVSLSRVLVTWTTNNSNLQNSYTCNAYNKSQCEFGGNTIIAAPLAVQFDYTACRVGNQTTVNFDSTTNGGIPPYTYVWDFDTNGTTDATIDNPTHVYNSLTNTATLTVTDSQNLTSSFVVVINSPNELQITGDVNSPGCSGGQTGSINLNVSGGTAPYTYLWSNGATTQNVSNLAPGNYSVVVKDSFGCEKSFQATISVGDLVPPVVTAPSATTVQGCGTQFVSNTPPYSATETAITIQLFNQLGGTVTDTSIITSVYYIDTFTGSCPTVISRTYKAYDDCQNVGTAQQTITVEDTTAPSFVETLPANVTVSCGSVPAAVTLTATDSCGTATVTFTESEVAGSCAGSTIITRTWTATDACGNSVSHVQTITVEDTTAPSFVEALPANVTVSCGSVPAAVTLTATDSC
ncbi:HYR-like domain-containing protein, partial [Flavobacterium orientale]|uniref:HYR-like domain-containing protein n=1 Tax=Flavobacterium orientale TaxID=1756020 RepID=UPI00402B1363